jgi:hypothetical protein
VVSVLREVCDRVLKDKTVSEAVLTSRAKVSEHVPFLDISEGCLQGLLLIGATFKATIPDETDAERRELERIVAEAAMPKKKKKASPPPPPVVKA